MKLVHLIIFVGFQASFGITFSQTSIRENIDRADEIYSKDPAQSFFFCEEAESIAETTGSTDELGDIALCKARYYLLIAKFDLCEIELNKAFNFFEQRSDIKALAYISSMKGVMHDKMGEDEKAHEYTLKTFNIYSSIQDTVGIMTSLNNLSLDYYNLGMLDSMQHALNELDKLKPHFDEQDWYFNYQNWGAYFSAMLEYDRAHDYYKKALNVAEKVGMVDSRATILFLIAQNFRHQENYREAERYAQESYVFALDNDLIYESSEALGELITILEIKGDYEEALQYQKKWIGLQGEIYNLEKIQSVKQMESQLELAEKEKEIAETQLKLKNEMLLGEQARSRNIWLYGVVVVIGLLLFFSILIYLRTRKLNGIIIKQKDIVELKSFHLEEALTSINDSLEYSKLIQMSILPGFDTFEKSFSDYSIFYEPKDIVSGDFYWINRNQNKTIIGVGDCTGHGVPGAMVSVVCNEALNKVVLENGISEPNNVLNHVRDLVVQTFSASSGSLNDGMDISLCLIEENVLKFAGAQNPLWVIRSGGFPAEIEEQHAYLRSENNDFTLLEIKGDKQPIGIYSHPEPFGLTELSLKENDVIYLFSDGYADQFGGDAKTGALGNGKKFKSANFKKLLLTVQHLDMEEQKQRLVAFFHKWKGDLEQVDDVCVIGIKI